MEFIQVYFIIAIVFGGVAGYFYMKPYYKQYQGDKRLPTARQRLMVAGKLGIAYSIAWAVSSVLMPLVIAEALYNAIKKYQIKKDQLIHDGVVTQMGKRHDRGSYK